MFTIGSVLVWHLWVSVVACEQGFRRLKVVRAGAKLLIIRPSGVFFG